MTDTIEVEAQGSLYDAGARTHRSEGDVFEVRESVVGKHGGLLEPVEDADDDSESESDSEDGAEDLTDLDGVGEATAEKLREAGAESVADVRGADPEALAEIDGISEDLAADLTESEE